MIRPWNAIKYLVGRAVRISLLVVAAYCVYYYFDPVNNKEYVKLGREYYVPELRTINADQVVNAIKAHRGVTMLYIYDSRGVRSRWYFDDINQYADFFMSRKLQTFIISTDTNRKELGAFLASQGQLNFIPYIMPVREFKALAGKLNQFQGMFESNIETPFAAVVDKQGVIRDFSGNFLLATDIRSHIERSLGSLYINPL